MPFRIIPTLEFREKRKPGGHLKISRKILLQYSLAHIVTTTEVSVLYIIYTQKIQSSNVCNQESCTSAWKEEACKHERVVATKNAVWSLTYIGICPHLPNVISAAPLSPNCVSDPSVEQRLSNTALSNPQQNKDIALVSLFVQEHTNTTTSTTTHRHSPFVNFFQHPK